MIAVTGLNVACTPTGLRSPGPSGEYAWTNHNNATPEQVLPEFLHCENKYLSLEMKQRNDESLDNSRARIQECMFAKGFYIKSGYGGYCSNPNYRAELPACLNTPIRPRQGYFGR